MAVFTKEELAEIRQEFPILDQLVHDGQKLIYFDNAATSQSPRAVVDKLVHFYNHDRANIHRGVHTLAERSTKEYEDARSTIAEAIGASDSSELIFTSGTTDGINMVARGLVEPRLNPGDQILTTKLEHHSNLVPWQELAERTDCELVFLDLDDNYQVIIPDDMDLSRAKVLAIHHVSNVIGVEQNIPALTKWAHENDMYIVVDGAQGAPHVKLKLSEWGVDAYLFSGHKIFGPTGIGGMYLNKNIHDKMQPVKFGGEMIHYVGDYTSNYKESPWKYEAGTMPIAQAIALAEAFRFVKSVGMDKMNSHVEALVKLLIDGLNQIDGIKIYQPASLDNHHGIVSFNFENIHPHDVATAYDVQGIAVRAGHHCCQPLMRQLDVAATVRASLMVYNSEEEVSAFIEASKEVKGFFDGFK